MDTPSPVTHIGLCAGYGGIELGLHRAVRGMRTVALCEIEAFAIANLVSKMEAGLMDPAPIWPDLKTFPWGAFRDRVDILTGGYPCQPFSAAGQRKGKQDPRHLWPFIADGIRLLRPKLCFFENVEGHISLGLSDVIEDLAGMGYRTTWGIFSAAECGAPHQRKRVFILAYSSAWGELAGSWSDSILRRERGSQTSKLQIQQERRKGCDEQGHIRHNADNGSNCSELAISSSLGGAAGLSGPFPWHEGQSGESDDGGHQAWPSRPGEQQYGWEPPRVVAGRQALDDTQERCLRDDSDNQRQTIGKSDTANDSGPCSGEAVADSHRIDRSAQAEGREHDRQAGPAGEELGNAGCQRQEERQLPTGGSEQSDQNMGDTGNTRWDDRDKSQQSIQISGWRCGENNTNHTRQTQPALGGDTDGPAGGMDYAELCVSGDNRTDELRLLGNGVVPATAERAFRVLIKELYTAPAGS